MPSSQPENKPPTCDRVFGSGAHTVKNIDGVACCTVCDIPCADHIQEVEPENQLDNDKDLRQEILYEFLNQFKEDKYLSQGNTDKAVGAIDQYTQSKLKAFAGEFEEAIGKDDRDYSQDNTDLASKIALVASSAACNELRVELRQALKAIKEKYQL